MKVTRIYTGADNQSHFEDLEIPLTPAQYGSMSELVPARGGFDNPADWHISR